MKEDFFWSPIDDDAPFGSDGGFDAAYGFHTWRKSHPKDSPADYLMQLISSWNFPPFAWETLDTNKIKQYMSISAKPDPLLLALLRKYSDEEAKRSDKKPLTDEELLNVYNAAKKNMGAIYLSQIDEALIATAFAQFVMEGKVDPSLINYASKAIQREMLPVITRQFGKPDQIKAHNAKMQKLMTVVNKMTS